MRQFEVGANQQPQEAPPNTQLIVFPQHLNAQISGLAYFLTPTSLLISQQQPSEYYYKMGTFKHLDPLCSLKLAQINCQNNNKETAYFHLIIASFLDLQYTQNICPDLINILKAIIKQTDPDLSKTPALLYQQVDLIQQEFLEHIPYLISYLNYLLNKKDYKTFINDYQLYKPHPTYYTHLISFIITPLNTNNKLIDLIIKNINNPSTLATVIQQCTLNLTFAKEDSELFQKQRDFLFECILIVNKILNIKLNLTKMTNQPQFLQNSGIYQNIWTNLIYAVQLLYQKLDLVTKPIHKSLIIRFHAYFHYKGNTYRNINPNIMQAIEIQSQELKQKKPTQHHFAIAYYYLAKYNKHASQNQESINYYNKSLQSFDARLHLDETDNHSLIICHYYISKLSKLNNEKLIHLNETLKLCQQHLNLVRTVQYHAIQKSAINKIAKYTQQLKNQQGDLDHEKEEQLRLLKEQHNSVAIRKSEIIQSNMQRSQFVKVPNQEIPMVKSILVYNSNHAETAMSHYASQLKDTDLTKSVMQQTTQKYFKEGLTFLQTEDIEHRSLVQKGSVNGGVFKIIVKGKQYGMKTLACIHKSQLETIMNQFKIYQSEFTHPNLRKTLAYSLEEIDKSQLNLGLVYDYTQFNLCSYKKDSPPQDKLHIVIDVVKALLYLHTKDVVHGNLKPSNVLVTQINSQVFGYLSDWEFTHNMASLNLLKDWGHTFGYSSPEIIFKKEKQFTKKSDLWSLGILIMYLFFQFDPLQTQVNNLLKNSKESNQEKMKEIYKMNQINNDEQDRTELDIQIFEIVTMLVRKEPSERENLTIVRDKLIAIQAKFLILQ